MIDLLLVLILLALLLPMLGVWVVAGTLGLIIKIVFVLIIVSMLLNFLAARSGRGGWW